MPKRTRSFRAQLLKDLADPREAACYVSAALDDTDEDMFLIALRDVAEARRMSTVANEAGVSRESIYRMLSKTGNPTHSTLRGILKALDLKLSVEAGGPMGAAHRCRGSLIERQVGSDRGDRRKKKETRTNLPERTEWVRLTGSFAIVNGPQNLRAKSKQSKKRGC